MGVNCLVLGYIFVDVFDKDGFYYVMFGNSVVNGYYGVGVLSQLVYEYFCNWLVGIIDNLQLNFCYMDFKVDYDFVFGVCCKDFFSGGKWVYYMMNFEKVLYLILNSIGVMVEVWIVSDGMLSVNFGFELCQMGVVGSVLGIICKMVFYSFQEIKIFIILFDFWMVIDMMLLGFFFFLFDVKYSGDGVSWINFGLISIYNKVFKLLGEYIYVFLFNVFFKKVFKVGIDLINKDELFIFYFDNFVIF